MSLREWGQDQRLVTGKLNVLYMLIPAPNTACIFAWSYDFEAGLGGQVPLKLTHLRTSNSITAYMYGVMT